MDRVKLWLNLFAMGYVFTTCLALRCTWETQIKCPPGEYPKDPCISANNSLCTKCTAMVQDSNSWCYCNPEKPLCSDDRCSNCMPRPQCKKGEQLNRTGNYKFSYFCEPCPNNTYNNKENGMCIAITNCIQNGLIAIFPGNRTHNARCGVETEKCSLTHTILVVCLAITTLICLALLIIVYIQRTVAKKRKNRHSSMHSVVMPSDECSCKLSKEEKGDEQTPSDSSEISSESSTLQCEV